MLYVIRVCVIEDNCTVNMLTLGGSKADVDSTPVPILRNPNAVWLRQMPLLANNSQ